MTTIILVTIGILVVILGYTTFNLLRKNEKLEDIIISQQNFIKTISVQIQQSEEKLNKIDEKGVFKGDDEIGWFFNEIKKIQNDLSQFRIN
jgi:HAMP domain-containing protein